MKSFFRKIIIIDDDTTSRVLARIVVNERRIADQVLVFPLAEEGLNYITQNCTSQKAATRECPDLILLDLHMPGKDGFEFLADLKQLRQKNKMEVKVVVVSSSVHSRDREATAGYDVHDYIEKPLSEEVILKLIGKG
jgi:CheY-like chemotaxis protein